MEAAGLEGGGDRVLGAEQLVAVGGGDGELAERSFADRQGQGVGGRAQGEGLGGAPIACQRSYLE